ncbi:MAG: lysophospholipid acyltransferase family protein [Bacteroidales bacterium]
MKLSLFDEEDFAQLSPVFRGRRGRFLAKIVMCILALNKINKVYAKTCHLLNNSFTTAWLKDLNVRYIVENREVLNRFQEGAFITVSNHPFGFIDGIIVIDLLTSVRPDFKFMVNSVLMNLRPIEGNMIGVKPTTTRSGSSVENTTGLKETLRHLKEGHVMGFFPAGAVSNYNEHKFRVTDREWQLTVIRMIQMAGVPVIPIHISGSNSWFFNLLGRINWQLRSLRLPYEILNKHKSIIKVTIGEPIALDKQNQYKKTEDLASFLRATTYSLIK